jgi:hypothetical protein
MRIIFQLKVLAQVTMWTIIWGLYANFIFFHPEIQNHIILLLVNTEFICTAGSTNCVPSRGNMMCAHLQEPAYMPFILPLPEHEMIFRCVLSGWQWVDGVLWGMHSVKRSVWIFNTFTCVMEKHVAQSLVQDILHQLCHVKNNTQNIGKILNRVTVGQHKRTKMLNFNWKEVTPYWYLNRRRPQEIYALVWCKYGCQNRQHTGQQNC